MTKLRDEAVARVRGLTDAEQDDAAAMLLDFADRWAMATGMAGVMIHFPDWFVEWAAEMKGRLRASNWPTARVTGCSSTIPRGCGRTLRRLRIGGHTARNPARSFSPP